MGSILGGLMSNEAYGQMRIDMIKQWSTDPTRFRFDPVGYIQHHFGWSPWSGGDHTGQTEIIDAYTKSIRQQIERHEYNSGLRTADELEYWSVGERIKTVISVDAGHTVGKTKLASGLLNHFFDCFVPSIIYSFAPTAPQIKDLLWKEVKSDRRQANLDGRILDLRLEKADNHFAIGRATNDSHGRGSERVQGQHGEYLMFVIDEAEGVPKFVFDATDSMTSGGIVTVVLVMRNPRTSVCEAHRIRRRPQTEALRISCLNHPNVVTGRSVIVGAVTREWVSDRIDEWCVEVDSINADNFTFSVPWRDGRIYEPVDQRFLWRVLGVVGGMSATDTIVPLGRYEAAVERVEPIGEYNAELAQIGIDPARLGDDMGQGYCMHDGEVWRFGVWYKEKSDPYLRDIDTLLRELHSDGVRHVSIRVDGGGGYGSGIIDGLSRKAAYRSMFKSFFVHEVQFGATAVDKQRFRNCATEMYANASEQLKDISVYNPPVELESDLTMRKIEFVQVGGREVMVLEKKEKFKRTIGRSPDDGDAFVLCVANERVIVRSGDGKQKKRRRVERSRPLIKLPKNNRYRL